MIIARKVRVTGLVQGVFFRVWTRDQANRLGVAGWVRNCPNGSVEAHVEGEADKIDQIIALLREGPPQARVENLTVETVEAEEVDGFSIGQ